MKVHEAFSFDTFQDRLLWFDDFHGDQIQDEWNSTIAGAGTNVVVDAQTGGIVRLTTGALTGNNNLLDWNDIRSLLVIKKVTMEVRAKLTQVTQNQIWIALRFDASNYMRFFVSSAGVATNWTIRNRSAGAGVAVDTGVLSDTSYHIFRIEAFLTGEAHYYIDGTECNNSPITTNIPANYLQPWIVIQTLEDAAKSMDVDYCYVRQNR